MWSECGEREKEVGERTGLVKSTEGGSPVPHSFRGRVVIRSAQSARHTPLFNCGDEHHATISRGAPAVNPVHAVSGARS